MKFRPVVFILTLLVVGIIITGVAIGQEGQGPEPQSPDAVTVANSFTYQGQLKSGGGGVNGQCDFQFELYNAVTGGSKIGSTLTKSNVNVVDGRFTVVLDFGGSAFTGTNRWLKIKVRCPAGSGSYTTLTPRQQLRAAPYALHANNAGTLDGNDSSAFSLTSHTHVGENWTGTETYGLRANTSDTYGLYGRSTATSGTRYGVVGVATNSTSGIGTYGSGSNYGLYGISGSNVGVYGNGGSGFGDYGGYFTGYNGVRVIGENSRGVESTSTSNAAGYFSSTAWDGVQGFSTSSSTGVWGAYTTGNGGYGIRAGTTDGTGTSFAGYFEDDIFVSGTCTGCVASTVALNGGSDTLEVGDLVSAAGITDPTSPESTTPTMMVNKTSNPLVQGAIGVVIGRFTTEIVIKEIEHVETHFEEQVNEETGETEQVPVDERWIEEKEVELVNLLPEIADPGEYVAFVSTGLAQVKVDASAGPIAVGQTLAFSVVTASLTGLQSAELAGPESIIIGTALEALPNGTGLIWVFLGGQ